MNLNETILENTTLEWFAGLGWTVLPGPSLAPGEPGAERADYGQVLLPGRLQAALARLNPALPAAAIDEALRRLRQQESPSLIENNRALHRMLTDGVDVAWRGPEGQQHGKAWVFDVEDLDRNDWLVVNQFTVTENRHERRADLVAFVNGLPLAVIELKNPADENATIGHAWQQLQTYQRDLPTLFAYNEALVISDGLQAGVGTLTAPLKRFLPWRTIDGAALAPEGSLALEVLVKGLFARARFLDYVLNFVTFEDDGGGSATLAKKAAAYHQFHAVNKALDCTFYACGRQRRGDGATGRFPAFRDPFGEVAEAGAAYQAGREFGDRRIGVVWHTQGSGKSLAMVFYAGKVIRHPAMENPTIVVLTDRNDLDDQLFGTFAANRDLLRQNPVQSESREHLRQLLTVPSGGVIFTTIQKFLPERKGGAYPLLSGRRNIVVIADEAHRSQYDFIDGFARHLRDALPQASFIGFTGTPIESADRSTPAVFGNYLDTYDILQAVADGATVPIYYESRMARIELDEDEKPGIDPEFEAITEAQEENQKQKLRAKWAALESMVGAGRRLELVAADLVTHFEQRLAVMDGKAMIVCMSRRICVALYEELVKLRPEWQAGDDRAGALKVVMTGSAADPASYQPHLRGKAGREALAQRFKDPDDPLRLVIVCDMWLTGFDCPCLHTMYLDKPLAGLNLMQAIARVNRVFRDKPGGLVVDYLGLAESLRRALHEYTASGGRGDAAMMQEEAVAVLLEKLGVLRDMLHRWNYGPLFLAEGLKRLQGVAETMNYVLGLEDGKRRFLAAVTAMSRAFALAAPHPAAMAARDEVAFLQEVRAGLAKATVSEGARSVEEIDTAVRQLVARAIAPAEVVDIFAAAGLNKPNIAILSDEFLEDMRRLPQRNLALEMLRKLLTDEIRQRQKKNLVEARSFAAMLEDAVRKYTNRALSTAEVLDILIHLARDMREARKRGEELGLTDDEMAFYDALEVNDSAVRILGDQTLKAIAQELVVAVRRNVTVDWSLRESARANMRLIVKRILRQHGYPPDKQERATKIVLEQAEVLCKLWAA